MRGEIEEADPDIHSDITAECKEVDWGRIQGRVVALDYCNLFEADDVIERRAYYERTDRARPKAAFLIEMTSRD